MAQAKQAIRDVEIRDAVLASIGKEPKLKSAKIDIEVDKGIVMLKGLVDNRKEMLAAERAAMAVDAVRGVADSIETRHARERPEKEIVEDVFRALKSNITVQSDRIRVRVADGKVTLEGTVDSDFQKLISEAIVKRIHGITGVTNSLEVKPATLEGQARGDGTSNGSGDSETLYSDIGGLEG